MSSALSPTVLSRGVRGMAAVLPGGGPPTSELLAPERLFEVLTVVICSLVNAAESNPAEPEWRAGALGLQLPAESY